MLKNIYNIYSHFYSVKKCVNDYAYLKDEIYLEVLKEIIDEVNNRIKI